ncbi:MULTISPECIES: MFS transporter [Bradyrhizobium]|jgi:MFS family permease|uniref:MFS transporter n=7 Tax=Bradyrhizobium TaxID=374 RepID=A0ABS5G956_9BRAD|nr:MULTISPECIES: MFS transporter [Bradyrhizobium]RTM01204.1 MAG: MFS transporter [Bradyrhizobiaceae bacterium]ABQ32955.1 Putative permease of the Major Facilitator Superfamily [Bradyrhizobium sp. BTAi1]MBR1137863.1 MFS transporter [Bradyrhizobium denitrificans]MCL8485316.1 MFS transporter [Bradyrhizobium denitrificans]MDU0953617.1 MFS transporter [Bradyrhizobium sp.]
MAAPTTLQGTSRTRPAATPKGAWKVTFLLFLFMLVNFADKIVVGLAGVPIMTELNLSAEQFGLLGSSFFFLFSISAIVVGFIVNKVPTRWVLLVLALVWAVAQFPMVGSVGFTTLLICRIILGAGEGPAASVAVHAIYKWFPDEKRAMPTAILSQGSAFGVILAVPALNFVIVNYGWHYAFGALGIVGLMWSAAWLWLGQEGPLAEIELAGLREQRVPYLQLLTSRTFVGCVAATFGAYWALSLGLTWFTPFLVKGLGFSQQQAGFISILPWVFGACVVMTTGWLSQRLMARGVSTRMARGVLGATPLIFGGMLMAAMPHVDGATTRIALLVVGSGLCGSIYVVCAPMIGEFTPVSQRGAVIAIYGALYTLAGIIAPVVMGKMIQASGSLLDGYMSGFTINAVIMVIAGLTGLALLWPNTERARLQAHQAVAPEFA